MTDTSESAALSEPPSADAREALRHTAFLSDEPPSTDYFGPHQAIAGQLAELISSNSKEKSIALIGEWGSGKTTVVKFLERDLRDALVFYYDAWIHQGDSLRRAFLDEFLSKVKRDLGIAHLASKDAEGAVKAQIERSDSIYEAIWNRSETVHIKGEPRLRRHAKWLFFSLVGVPLGLEFLTIPESSGPAFWTSLLVERNILALGLLVFPAIFVLFLSVVRMATLPFLHRLFFGEEDPSTVPLSSFLLERTSETIETKVTRSPIDSIDEFRKSFERIVSLAKESDNGRQIVIVFDNIDRLPPSDGQSFWSTMQIFFPRPAASRGSAGSYYLIVPFAEAALKAFFEDDASTAQSNIEKAFDLSLPLPPPINTDWRNYLVLCLRSAFPDHPIAELLPVRDVIEALGVSPAEVTPRALKSFVNSLALQYRMLGHELSLQAVSAYLWRRHLYVGTQVEDGVLTPPAALLLQGEADAITQVTAARFGVSLEKAAHIRLSDPIRASLMSGGSSLGDQVRQSGFYEVLSDVVRESFLLNENIPAEYFVNAASALLSIRDVDQVAYQHLLGNIGKGVSRIGPLSAGVSSMQTEGLSGLLEVGGLPAQRAFARVLESFQVPVPDELLEAAVGKLLVVADTLSSFGHDELRTPPSNDRLSLLLLDRAYVTDSPTRFAARQWEAESLYAALTWLVTHSPLQKPLSVLREITIENAEGLANTTVSRAASDESQHLGRLIDFLLALAPYPTAIAIIRAFAAGERLEQLASWNDEGRGLRAGALSLMIVAAPKTLGPNGRALSSLLSDNEYLLNEPDPDLVSSIVSRLTEANLGKVALEVNAPFTTLRPLVASALTDLIAQGAVGELTTAEVLSMAVFFGRHFSPRVIASAVRNSGEEKAIRTQILAEDLTLDRLALYAGCTQLATVDGDRGFIEGVSARLLELPASFWINVLTNADPDLDWQVAAIRDIRRTTKVELKVEALNAALEVMKSIGAGLDLDDHLKRRFDEFMKLLPSRQTSFSTSTCNWLLAQDEATILRVVEALHATLKVPSRLDTEAVARQILLPVIGTGRLEMLEWARDQLQTGRRRVTLSEGTRQDLSDMLLTYDGREDLSGAQKELLAIIAS